MKFWDTSALAPLIVDEPSTPAIRRLLAQDAEVVVWMLTSVELLSVLGRLGRTAAGLDDLIPRLRSDATSLLRHVATVTDVDGVRRRAERLVGVHPLAAADAMQLGAALVACGDRPERLTFVTLDKTLGRSAQLEGFRVLGIGNRRICNRQRQLTSIGQSAIAIGLAIWQLAIGRLRLAIGHRTIAD